jgi:hypothetical protein
MRGGWRIGRPQSKGSLRWQTTTPTRGAAKNPEHDGRPKQNRDSDDTNSTSHATKSHESDHETTKSHEPDYKNGKSANCSHECHGHSQGTVKDPAHNGRLTENREKGAHEDA